MWVRRVLVFKAKSPILEEGWLLASSGTEVCVGGGGGGGWLVFSPRI